MLNRATEAFAQVGGSGGWGPDTEWFASDRDGHVAVLSTAGLGPIPNRVLDDPAGHVAVWDELETLGIREGLGELNFESLDMPLRFGAFVFDYSRAEAGYGQYLPRQHYRRVGSPERPVKNDELSADAHSFLAAVCFRNACFAEVDGLVVEDAFDSIHRPTLWDRSPGDRPDRRSTRR
jgi:hypothetical protein